MPPSPFLSLFKTMQPLFSPLANHVILFLLCFSFCLFPLRFFVSFVSSSSCAALKEGGYGKEGVDKESGSIPR